MQNVNYKSIIDTVKDSFRFKLPIRFWKQSRKADSIYGRVGATRM